MMQRTFQEIIEKVYGRLKKSRLAVWCFPKAVYQDMDVLGKEAKSYYIQKLTYLAGLMVFSILLFALYLVQWMTDQAAPVKEIVRPEVYEEPREIVIQAGRLEHTYELEVSPVILTKEGADALFQEVVGGLGVYILGQNESLECVTENLYLPDYIPEYPFEIYWQSDKEHIMDTMGTVDREGLVEDEVVILTAVFQYKDWSWEEQFGILVCKEVLSEEAEYERRLEYLLTESEKSQRGEGSWVLPETFQGESLSAYVVKEDCNLLILAGLVLMAAVAAWIGQDYDLHAERQKRRGMFQEEYIAFVGSLSLYISAGLTLQTAMQYCMRDYVKRKPQGHLLRNALQEFQRDIQNGCGFMEAMEAFANKTDDINYKRLAGMISQGMINGSQGLAEVLEREVEKVREEKRRQSKVKGEQVSTALIAPMMLELGMIIALIMIPAFSNMQF